MHFGLVCFSTQSENFLSEPQLLRLLPCCFPAGDEEPAEGGRPRQRHRPPPPHRQARRCPPLRVNLIPCLPWSHPRGEAEAK